MRLSLLLLAVLLIPVQAQAYIGPGLAAGTIAAVLGVIGAVLLAVFAIVYYPVKRMLRRRKPAPKSN